MVIDADGLHIIKENLDLLQVLSLGPPLQVKTSISSVLFRQEKTHRVPAGIAVGGACGSSCPLTSGRHEPSGHALSAVAAGPAVLAVVPSAIALAADADRAGQRQQNLALRSSTWTHHQGWTEATLTPNHNEYQRLADAVGVKVDENDPSKSLPEVGSEICSRIDV